MKLFFGVTIVSIALSAGYANAAQLSVVTYPQNVYAIFIDGQSTVFNVLSFNATPNDGVQFQNVAGAPVQTRPRPPGFPVTERNRGLDADPAEYPEGRGWSILGAIRGSNRLAFDGSPLGQLINTASEPDGKLFLANLMLPTSTATATVNVKLYDAGNFVSEQTLIVGVPEPATIAMAGMGLVGMIAVARRHKAQLIH